MESGSTAGSECGERFRRWTRSGIAILFVAAGIFCFLPREFRGDGDLIPASSDSCIPPETWAIRAVSLVSFVLLLGSGVYLAVRKRRSRPFLGERAG